MAITVAETILQQLGGARFRVMTGAKNFVAFPDDKATPGIQMDLPRNSKRVSRIVVKLSPMDTYSVMTYRRFTKNGLPQFDLLDAVEDVYVDNLQEVFTSMTGLYTSL